MPDMGLLEEYNGPLLLGDIDTSNLLLMNVLYHRGTAETKWRDAVSVVLKDVRTGEKKLVQINDPEMLMYTVKKEYQNFKYTPAYMKLDKCDVKRIKYRNVINEISEFGGDLTKNFKKQCRDLGNGKAVRNLHKYPYVLGTDVNYVDYFRCEWALHYHNKNIEKKLSMAYLDIEVDAIDIPGFPSAGCCPINAVSLVDPDESTVYVFLLRTKKNKEQIDEFEKNIKSFKDECRKSFDESYGELDYRFFMYDQEDEIKMIQQIFALINKRKYDFLLIWNMAFDIPFFIERIKELGYDPADIMCSPDFEHKDCYYHKDNFHYDFKTRNDYFVISSYTVFLDQMMQYIKIRKQKSELKSVKLNAIAQKELNDEKLDYSDEANIKTFPYVNYPKFVLYNIKDTLLLYGIEKRTHDIDNIFDRCMTNGTKYQSLFSQTILLKNRAYISYFTQGYIIGNNRNVDYSKDRFADDDEEEDEDKYAGAIVGDPVLNGYVGATIFGKNSKWVFNKVVDMD